MENGGGGSEGGGRKSGVRESARDETAAQVWQRDLYSGAGLTTQSPISSCIVSGLRWTHASLWRTLMTFSIVFQWRVVTATPRRFSILLR